jgi:hypothetical protein
MLAFPTLMLSGSDRFHPRSAADRVFQRGLPEHSQVHIHAYAHMYPYRHMHSYIYMYMHIHISAYTQSGADCLPNRPARF